MPLNLVQYSPYLKIFYIEVTSLDGNQFYVLCHKGIQFSVRQAHSFPCDKHIVFRKCIFFLEMSDSKEISEISGS
jgi:hypothetical protein